jgi:hypothetical protein
MVWSGAYFANAKTQNVLQGEKVSAGGKAAPGIVRSSASPDRSRLYDVHLLSVWKFNAARAYRYGP